jgi:DNA repair/transcription protein MET18/MMS19
MDGERDPENLMLFLKIIPKITEIATKSVENISEEFFDVISCYFPITYTSDSDDANITAKELSNQLLYFYKNKKRECMGSNVSFAKYCMPLLIDKLSSNLNEIKLQTLRAMQYCIKAYGRENIKQEINELIINLKTELLKSNEDIYDEILETTKIITNLIFSKESKDNIKLIEGIF